MKTIKSCSFNGMLWKESRFVIVLESSFYLRENLWICLLVLTWNTVDVLASSNQHCHGTQDIGNWFQISWSFFKRAVSEIDKQLVKLWKTNLKNRSWKLLIFEYRTHAIISHCLERNPPIARRCSRQWFGTIFGRLEQNETKFWD